MAELIFVNKSDIEISLDLLNRIVELADLPNGRILLVFHSGPLFNNYLGVTIPRNVHSATNKRDFLFEYIKEDWDCAIAFSAKALNCHKQFPAFFVYLIGHEFGHANICLSDETLHIHYCLIQKFIGEASNGRINSWHELPHEILFDKYGIFIAENIYSRRKLNLEIGERLKMPDCKDRKRIEQMRELSATNYLGDLREKLIRFSLPYKAKLIELWKKEYRERGNESLTRFITDYDGLFEY